MPIYKRFDEVLLNLPPSADPSLSSETAAKTNKQTGTTLEYNHSTCDTVFTG